VSGLKYVFNPFTGELDAVPRPRLFNIVLLGVIDGLNTVFTTPHKFVNQLGSDTLLLYYNGQRLLEVDDYLLSEGGGYGQGYDTVTTLFAPKPGDKLTVDYTKR
jgi:hypothetical protein